MRKNKHDWQVALPQGKYSKLYKTYGAAYRLACKVWGTADADSKILIDGRWVLDVWGLLK